MARAHRGLVARHAERRLVEMLSTCHVPRARPRPRCDRTSDVRLPLAAEDSTRRYGGGRPVASRGHVATSEHRRGRRRVEMPTTCLVLVHVHGAIEHLTFVFRSPSKTPHE